MSDLVSKLKTPSPHHEVKIQANGFLLCPLDESVSALDDFQVVAEEAIHYAGDEYKVIAESSNTNSAGKYRKVFFKKLKNIQ